MVGYPLTPYPSPSDIRPGNLNPLLLTSGGHDRRYVPICSLEDLPLPLDRHLVAATTRMGWQAHGTHPTGMLSCWQRFR